MTGISQMSRSEAKAEIFRRYGVHVPTRFINCMIAECIMSFEQLLTLDIGDARRIPNFGATMVELLKKIQQSQDPALHQDNQAMLIAVRDQTVELILRLRTEIPAFNIIGDEEQVQIVLNLRMREFDLFKKAALDPRHTTPQRGLRAAMTEFGFNQE